MFRPSDDSHLTFLIRSWETQHFSQHISCFKHSYYPRTTNSVRHSKSVSRNKIPGNNSQWVSYKVDKFSCCLVHFSRTWHVCVSACFSIHDVLYSSVTMIAFVHKSDIRAIFLQALVSETFIISSIIVFPLISLGYSFPAGSQTET